VDLTHFFDGLFVAVPATVGAVAALFAAKNTSKTRKEVKSPNGTTTGQAVHDLGKHLNLITEAQATHEAKDDLRFDRIEKALAGLPN